MRLSQYLSQAGVCSRREARRLIQAGRVSVNQQTANLHTQVTESDCVQLDQQTLITPEPFQYVIYHKPVGVDCNCKHDDPTSIVHHVPTDIRLFPVGRIDKDSHGLMLLTNDGALAQRLLSPDYHHPKVYQVSVRPFYNQPDIGTEFVDKMQQGVMLKETLTRPCIVRLIGVNQFEITLTQGLNRQIRRMCKALGYHVTDLKRTQLLNLTLAGLAVGACRPLSALELSALRDALNKA